MSAGIRSKDWIWYTVSVLLTPLVISLIGLTERQTLAVAGFSVILFGAIFFWRYRLAFSCFGITFLLALNLLDVPHLVEFAGLDIILFLIAMMTIIGFMEERFFFEFVIEKLLLVVGPHPRRIMVVMMVMASISAALVDEVTSILFMMAALLNLLGRSKVSPVPFVLMIVFATNIGSSATVVGNQVGVIIAMRSGLTFADFIRWATPISLVTLAYTIPVCLWIFRKPIADLKGVLTGRRGQEHIERIAKDKATTRTGIRQGAWVFSLVVLGLVFHHQIEYALGLQANTMLIGVALAGAGVALSISGAGARKLVETRVDWWTLAFFLMLFASVGTLKQQGVTGVIAQRVIEVSAGNIPVLITVFAWTSGALTAVMDNVLAVATYVPIISDVGAAGLQTFPLWWATLFGCTLMGNLTLIGSTANIVAVGLMERRQVGEITFAQWLTPGALVAIPTLIIANLLIIAQLGLMPHAVANAVVGGH